MVMTILMAYNVALFLIDVAIVYVVVVDRLLPLFVVDNDDH